VSSLITHGATGGALGLLTDGWLDIGGEAPALPIPRAVRITIVDAGALRLEGVAEVGRLAMTVATRGLRELRAVEVIGGRLATVEVMPPAAALREVA
jgi:hypothetical protein